jgi:hypothetical protein
LNNRYPVSRQEIYRKKGTGSIFLADSKKCTSPHFPYRLIATTTGTIQRSTSGPWLDASGATLNTVGGTGFTSTIANIGALLGRIGETGEIFYIGTYFDLPAPEAGDLYLIVNDDYRPDNAGNFTAQLCRETGDDDTAADDDSLGDDD